MAERILILGASGLIGSHVVRQLDRDSDGLFIRLATSRPRQAEEWRAQGRDAVVLDLDHPSGFAAALKDVDRVFLLTGYTAAMLYQSKKFVDAAVEAGVGHIVHLGVFSSNEDLIPHFNWHMLVEAYIKASGIAWIHLHPNSITDSTLATDPPIDRTGTFTVFWHDVPQGWVCTSDIGTVAATILREGPAKHGCQDYWLSIEVLTGPEIADILTEHSEMKISCRLLGPDALQARANTIQTTPERAYMESAVIYMEMAVANALRFQTAVRDDLPKISGRPGISMAQWARENLARMR